MNSENFRQPLSAKQKLGVTSPFALLAVAHLIWPNLGIDATTIILITLASIPWIWPYIKSLELPGLGKIELGEVKSATDKITTQLKEPDSEEQRSLKGAEDKDQDLVDALFFSNLRRIAETDSGLSLVGFRIELEKRLQKLAERENIPTARRPLRQIVIDLQNKGLLESYFVSGIMELIPLGNKAAHGAAVSEEAVDWVLNVGPKILKSLDKL